MFSMTRWILGLILAFALIGYAIYENSYNTPEARMQRNVTAGIENIQNKTSNYTGIQFQKEKSFLEKSSDALAKGWNAVVSEISKQAPAIQKQVKNIKKEATKTYSKAMGISSPSEVKP